MVPLSQSNSPSSLTLKDTSVPLARILTLKRCVLSHINLLKKFFSIFSIFFVGGWVYSKTVDSTNAASHVPKRFLSFDRSQQTKNCSRKKQRIAIVPLSNSCQFSQPNWRLSVTKVLHFFIFLFYFIFSQTFLQLFFQVFLLLTLTILKGVAQTQWARKFPFFKKYDEDDRWAPVAVSEPIFKDFPDPVQDAMPVLRRSDIGCECEW